MPYSSYLRHRLVSSVVVEGIVRAIRTNLDANRHPRGGDRDTLNPVDRLLTGSSRRFLEIFRVTIAEFEDLITWL
jgi:hypothetical protein